ncbi:hypothetical protein GCM10009780_61860 [Actinomadura alba]
MHAFEPFVRVVDRTGAQVCGVGMDASGSLGCGHARTDRLKADRLETDRCHVPYPRRPGSHATHGAHEKPLPPLREAIACAGPADAAISF